MSARELKVAGVLALMIVFTLTITSCDLGDDPDPEPEFIETAEELEALEVDYGTEAEEVVESLNEKRDEVLVTLNTGEEVTADAAWDEDSAPEDYDPHTPDTYIFAGTASYDDMSYDLDIDVVLLKEDDQEDSGSIAGEIFLENEESAEGENELAVEVTAESAENNSEIFTDSVIIDDPAGEYYYEFEDMPAGEEFNLAAEMNTEETTAENVGSFSFELEEETFVVEAGEVGPEITVLSHDLLIEEEEFLAN